MKRFGWGGFILWVGLTGVTQAADMSVKLKTTDGSTALSIQNSSSVEVSSITSLGDGYFRNIRASNLVVNNTVVISTTGHLRGGGGTPTISASTTLGTITPSIAGTDTAGEITAVSGVLAVGGMTITVTFNSAYTTAPYVVLTPSNSAAASLLSQLVVVPLYVNSSTTNFTLNAVGAGTLLAGTTFRWHYHVIQ